MSIKIAMELDQTIRRIGITPRMKESDRIVGKATSAILKMSAPVPKDAAKPPIQPKTVRSIAIMP